MYQFAQTQADAAKNIKEIHEASLKFNEEMLDLVCGRTQAGRKQGHAMAYYMMRSKWDPREIIEDSTCQENHLNQRHTEMIVNSLLFPTVNQRERAIPEAYRRTYDWIFHEPHRILNDSELWHSFPQWLEGPSREIYWITGKPGAGKSTLVKYILADPRLKPALMKWSQQRPLIMAGYFSWNAGTGLQKSHEGLLRTILYQCLQLQPDLVPRVFPRRWAALWLFPSTVLPDWDHTEILDAFKSLVFEHGKSYSFAFIIDGLDEFEDDHQQLIELLQLVNRQENVKICASSRPWNSFRDAFTQSPKLQLEHLTKNDIDIYVRDHFEESQGFRELSAMRPSEAGELVSEVVKKSKGVFLWVSVVVKMLLDNLSEGDKVTDLQRTLLSLPDDIRQLFDHMLASIDPKYHSESSRLFQMMIAAEECDMIVYCLSLYFADDDVPVNIEIENVSGGFLTDALSVVQRRLSSRTKGILEVHRSPQGLFDHFTRVEYLHRTAKEWVTSRSIETRAMDSEFDPFLFLLKGEVIRIRAGKHALRSATDAYLSSPNFWSQINVVLRCALMVEDIPRNHDIIVQLLENVDRHVSAIWKMKDQDGTYLLTSRRMAIEANYFQDPVPDPRSHWCNSSELNGTTEFRPSLEIDFLRGMAQVPVPAYIAAKAHKSPEIVTIEVLRDIAFAHIPWSGRTYVLDGRDIVLRLIFLHPNVQQQNNTIRLNLLDKLLSYDHTGAIWERLFNDCLSLSSPSAGRLDIVPSEFKVYIETLKGKLEPLVLAKRGKKNRVTRHLRKLRQYFTR